MKQLKTFYGLKYEDLEQLDNIVNDFISKHYRAELCDVKVVSHPNMNQHLVMVIFEV